MRVPHTISSSTLAAHQPSSQTLDLVGERGRKLRAEDWEWDVGTPPSLVETCIQFFVSNFTEHKRVITFLEEDNMNLLLETLPTSLSLDVVIPLIPDGIYWKRRCSDSWSINNDVTRYEDSWKRIFVERYIEELIENEEPGFTDWTEVDHYLKLCSPYVKRLDISQLKPPRSMESVPKPPDLCNTEEFVPEHLDLSHVLIILENLEDISLQFGVKNIGMDFAFKFFRIHIKDVERLAFGLQKSMCLKILRIVCSDIDDSKLLIMLKSLEVCSYFHELEISHCKISDSGAKALGHFISVKPSLKILKLQNNFIKTEGAQGIAYALTLDRAELESIDLKFNLIGEDGGKYFATALSKSRCLQCLNLSGCGLEAEAGRDLAHMLELNSSLLTLDLSNNHLGLEVGDMIATSLEANHSVLNIDVRNCGFSEGCKNTIHSRTLRNRNKIKKQSFIKLTIRDEKMFQPIRAAFLQVGKPIVEDRIELSAIPSQESADTLGSDFDYL